MIEHQDSILIILSLNFNTGLSCRIKIAFFTILGCFIALMAAPQQKTITLNDTAGIDTYNKLVGRYRYDKPDSATFYAQKGLALAIKQKNLNGQGMMLNQLGMIADNVGKYDDSRTKYHKALNLYRQTGNSKGMAAENIRLGVVEMRSGNFDKATGFFLEALSISQHDGNKMGVMEAYITLGEAYSGQHKYNVAIPYLKKAEALNNQLPFSNLSLNLFNDIAIAYRETDRLAEAKAYLDKGIAQSNIAQYQGLNITLINTLASVYAKEGDIKTSIALQKTALEKARRINNYIRQMLTLTGLAASYTPINVKEALNYNQQALELARTKDDHKQMVDILNNMAELYAVQKDYKAAYLARKERYEIADKYFYKAMSKQIASLQAAYELNLSKAQVQQLSFANKQQSLERKGIVSVLFGIVVLLMIIAFFFYKTSQLNELLHKTNTELKESNNVKDKLFSVLGHDLRSPFVSVINLLELLEDEDIDVDTAHKLQMLQQLKTTSKASLEILTNLLKWGEMQIKGVRLNQRSFSIRNVIETNALLLSETALRKSITINNMVSDEIQVYADSDHFEFIIRNLISNAIKFSYNGGQINLSAITEGDYVHITVADKGVGLAMQQAEHIFSADNISSTGTENEKGTSLGLLLCKEFIELNGGSIHVDSTPGKGSAFTFTLQAGK